MSSKGKRLAISLETKYKIIQLLDKNTDYSDILIQFKGEIKDSYNISKIKKDRERIISQYESSTSTKVKKLRKAKYPEIDNELLGFISECNSKGVPINTILLKEKAKEIAKHFNYSDFNASNGFIGRFKERNAVMFQTIHGESDGVSETITSDWINNKLPELIKDYDQNDIFNGDEFGLFWRILPNKTCNKRAEV